MIRKQQTSYHTYLELLMETYDIYLRIKEQNISVDYMNQIDEDEFVEIIKYRAFHMLDGYFYPEYAMYMDCLLYTSNNIIKYSQGMTLI